MSPASSRERTSRPSRRTVTRWQRREDLLEPVRDEEHGGAGRRAASRRRGRGGRPRRPRAPRSARPSRSPCASSDSAFAISTICCSAIERPRAIRPGSSRTPSRSKISAACGVHRARVDPAPGAQRLAADEDVLGDRQVGEQDRLLVDDRDARRRVPRPGRPSTTSSPVDAQRAAVREVHAARGSSRASTCPAPFSPTSACTSPA